jgi:hypothetical protein
VLTNDNHSLALISSFQKLQGVSVKVLFDLFDLSNNGSVNKNEFQRVLHVLKIPMTDDELTVIWPILTTCLREHEGTELVYMRGFTDFLSGRNGYHSVKPTDSLMVFMQKAIDLEAFDARKPLRSNLDESTGSSAGKLLRVRRRQQAEQRKQNELVTPATRRTAPAEFIHLLAKMRPVPADEALFRERSKNTKQMKELVVQQRQRAPHRPERGRSREGSPRQQEGRVSIGREGSPRQQSRWGRARGNHTSIVKRVRLQELQKQKVPQQQKVQQPQHVKRNPQQPCPGQKNLRPPGVALPTATAAAEGKPRRGPGVPCWGIGST